MGDDQGRETTMFLYKVSYKERNIVLPAGDDFESMPKAHIVEKKKYVASSELKFSVAEKIFSSSFTKEHREDIVITEMVLISNDLLLGDKS